MTQSISSQCLLIVKGYMAQCQSPSGCTQVSHAAGIQRNQVPLKTHVVLLLVEQVLISGAAALVGGVLVVDHD